MKPGAFLFDLDGTLVDTEALWTRAIVDLLEARGVKTRFDAVVPMVIGRNWFDIDRSLHERFPEMGNTTLQEDAAELRGYFDSYAADPKSMIIESSVEFLVRASKLAPVAIVSGSPHDDVVKAAKLCGVSEYLKFVLGGEDYEEGKPSPSGYLKAAEMLGVAPRDCVVVEDSCAGVKSGVAAGMNVIALDRSTLAKQDFEGERWLVKDLSEFDWGAFE